jgi:hypothetical protein
VNTGDILLPAIAAAAFISPFTITPGAMAVAPWVPIISPKRGPVKLVALPDKFPVIVPYTRRLDN